MLPFSRNGQFVGRDKLFQDIRFILEKPGDHSRVVLYGLTGVGKSEIALEYVYRHRQDSPETSVFWLDAQSSLRFEQDFLKIGNLANLIGATSFASQKELLLNWLASEYSGRWLMVIENANDVSVFSEPDNLIGLIPRPLHGTIIFLTRDRHTGLQLASSYRNAIPVKHLCAHHARELLQISIGRSHYSEKDTVDGDRLLQLLEYLPLAISHAGGYINANEISISEYLDMFQANPTSRIELLNNGNTLHGGFDSNTSKTTTRTLIASFDHLRMTNAAAANVLSFMVCFTGQRIPKAIIVSESLLGSRISIISALGILQAYSLIIYSLRDDAYDIHSLVHLIIRNYLDGQNALRLWKEMSIQAVHNALSSNVGDDKMSMCDTYIPHVMAMLDQNCDSQEQSATRAKLAYLASLHLQRRGKYQYAEEYARKSLDPDDSLSKTWNAQDLSRWCNLATTLRYQGQYKAAIEIDNNVTRKREILLGSDNEETLGSRINLALSLQGDGQYLKAEEIHRLVLCSKEKTLGLEHAETLMSMHNLADVLLVQGKIASAKYFSENVVRLRRKVFGSRNIDTLRSISCLANIISQEGNSARAEALHLEALRGREEHLGCNHPDTLRSLDNLAVCLHKQKRFERSVVVAKQAYEGWLGSLGETHPETLRSADNLSAMLADIEEFEEAENLCRKVVQHRTKTLGVGHPDTVMSINNFEWLLQIQEQRAYGKR